MGLLGSGLLPHFGIAGGGGLTGSTWAIDGSGRAYNTPTLGAELLTDGGFENWSSATNLTSWIETLAGTTTLNQESVTVNIGSNALRIDVDGSNSNSFVRQNSIITIGTWLCLVVELRASATPATAAPGSTNFPWSLSLTPVPVTTSWQNITLSGRASGTGIILGIISAASKSVFFDDATLKTLSVPTLHAAKLGSANNLISSARINALTTNTQAGTFALVDNPASPANGIYAYHDGTGVTLDKLVGGTWSNVNARVTIAFSADADLEIRPLGSNQFDVYYGGVKRGATATISDAGIASNLYYGLFSTYASNTFTRFTLGGNVVPFGF
jgi:hypothetical protein